MFRFVAGGYDCGNNKPYAAANRAKDKCFSQAQQQEDVCSLRRLREMTGDALCTWNYFQTKVLGVCLIKDEHSTEDTNCLQT